MKKIKSFKQSETSGKTMRFLIVDDDKPYRMRLQRYFKAYAQCDVAINGAQAVEAFQMAHAQGRPYDLIFLDIMLPVKNGQEALLEIRRHERSLGIDIAHGTRVVVFSTLSDPKNVVNAYYEGGASLYLLKPADKGLLLEAIRIAGIKL